VDLQTPNEFENVMVSFWVSCGVLVVLMSQKLPLFHTELYGLLSDKPRIEKELKGVMKLL